MFFVWVFCCVFGLKPGFKLVCLNFEVGHFVCFLRGFFAVKRSGVRTREGSPEMLEIGD